MHICKKIFYNDSCSKRMVNRKATVGTTYHTYTHTGLSDLYTFILFILAPN